MASLATNPLGILSDVFMVNCARAVSYAMVEDKETQYRRPFKIEIRPEHPDICRTDIASAKDFGVGTCLCSCYKSSLDKWKTLL